VQHELETLADAADVAHAGAGYVTRQASEAVRRSGTFHFAVSGGHTPWVMFAELAKADIPWDSVVIYQVDERVAPADDPDRNLYCLSEALNGVSPRVVSMPVEDEDLDAAAASYADQLPDRFDLVHLGLGPDGHTASLVPGDPVLSVKDRLVAVTQPYQDRVRMTLTYPALARARQLLWLVTGAEKREPLTKLMGGDTSIPAGRVEAERSLVMADTSAAAALRDH
jgi:6-phosphogluconolactonase